MISEKRRGRTRAEHAPEAANRLAAAPACCWLCLWHTNGERRSLQRSLVVEREAHSDGVHARVAPASGGAVVRLSVPQAARRRSHHLPQVLAEGRLEDQFVPRRLVMIGLSHRSCQTCTPRRDTGCEPLSRCGHRSRPCCSGRLACATALAWPSRSSPPASQAAPPAWETCWTPRRR